MDEATPEAVAELWNSISSLDHARPYPDAGARLVEMFPSLGRTED